MPRVLDFTRWGKIPQTARMQLCPGKPDSPACARNREPILAVLRQYFADRFRALEIASGTGQHAVYFARALPHLSWQCSDQADALAGIQLWLDDAALANTPTAVPLRIPSDPWPTGPFDAVFTANSLHIMSWPQVEALFTQLSAVLAQGARLVVYGPFHYRGRTSAASNLQFDRWLSQQSPHSAIRQFEAVDGLARAQGLRLLEDRPMPANNHCLIWQL